jgi:hypothetical protein
MSTFASPIPNGKTSPAGFLRILGKVFTGSGVIEANALKVSAQDTPDMTVKVSGSILNDNAILIHTDGTFIHAWNDQSANVTIGANSTGVIKTDSIVAYVDLSVGTGASSPPNNQGALKFMAVRRSGSSVGSPSHDEINTAVSGNPYVLLGYVAINSGASSINSGNVVDARTRSTFYTPMMAAMYPIGSIYTNAAVATNPATLLGFGTWTAFGSGRVLVGVDTTQTEFDTLGETGGAKSHTLSVAEMPAHRHALTIKTNTSGSMNQIQGAFNTGGSTAGAEPSAMSETGSSQAHNNLQPYITVYMWRRTA